MKQRLLRWCCCVVLILAPAGAPADEAVDADIVLRGATIHDGTGADPVRGDVAIRDDRIVAVGAFTTGQVVWDIDCAGLVIAPGFIDLHNHSDSWVVKRRTRGLVNYLMQGCTTVVTGNCGSGPIDVAEYYGKIESAGVGANVAHLLPQGRLRDTVVGKEQRAATPEEIGRMRKLAETAMREGAWGMSTGLIYVPGSYSSTEELIAIAQVVSQHGGIYASHIRNEGTSLLASIDEALKIGRGADLPVHVSHFKSSGRDAWGLIRQAVAVIEKARAGGQRITADQYPYIASSTSLTATIIPVWARSGGQSELVRRLEDAETGSRIRKAMQESLEKKDDGQRIQIARYSHRPDWVGRRIREIAEAENTTPLEIALQITRKGGASIVNFSMQEEDVRFAMRQPWVATASDGRAYVPSADRPHPRNYGTFPRKIGHYARDEGVLTEAQAIRSATSLPAEILGLPQRGRVQAGYFADLVVYAPQELIDRATFSDPHQYCGGVRHVFVNGAAAVLNGTPTGDRAGRALRRAPRQTAIR